MPSHAKRCRYCRVSLLPGVAPTVDHVVPKWVLRAYPERFGRHGNTVMTCAACNHSKALLPAALFVAVRLDPAAKKEAFDRWAFICYEVGRVMGGVEKHRAAIYAEFGRPIPPHFPTGQQKIEVRAGAEAAHPGIFLEESK